MQSTAKQSARHLLMIEPASFYANPETMDTNVYQAPDGDVSRDELFQRALREFRTFRDALVENGVVITCLRGYPECPDMVFPNWFSAHQDGKLYIYPMLNENRSKERAPFLIDILKKSYGKTIDLSADEEKDIALESTASMVMDRVNKIAYSALSPRTNKEAAQKWADEKGYTIHFFETKSHTGKPVYHTDVVMWVGTELAAICTECILPDYRDMIYKELSKTHTVIELTMDQLNAFSGNALEVLGTDNQRMLAISTSGYSALSADQKSLINKYFTHVIHSDLSTLETYGGGSARCCLAELF